MLLRYTLVGCLIYSTTYMIGVQLSYAKLNSCDSYLEETVCFDNNYENINIQLVKHHKKLYFLKDNLFINRIDKNLVTTKKNYFKVWHIYANKNPKQLQYIRIDYLKNRHLYQQLELKRSKKKQFRLTAIRYYNTNQKIIREHVYKIISSSRYSENISYYNNFDILFKKAYYVYHLPSNKIFSEKIESNLINNHANRGKNQL